jgi:hypothetical protein
LFRYSAVLNGNQGSPTVIHKVKRRVVPDGCPNRTVVGGDLRGDLEKRLEREVRYFSRRFEKRPSFDLGQGLGRAVRS